MHFGVVLNINRFTCKESFWTPEKPAENSKQLLCGFFYGGIKTNQRGSG